MKLDRFDDLEQNQFDIRYSIGQPETVLELSYCNLSRF